MKVRRYFALASTLILLALAASSAPALGQNEQWISYAAKFVCGSENAVPDRILVSGRYRTLINIHNPHYLMEVTGAPSPVVFFKKAVVALPQGEVPYPPSCKVQERLGPDAAVAVSCANIIRQLQATGIFVTRHFEGFLVIEVPPQGQTGVAPELDVSAVYVARHRTGTNADVTDYDVQTMDVEQIAPKAIIGEPTLDLCPPD